MSNGGDHRDQRREYSAAELSSASLPEEPLVLFESWLGQALAAGAKDATAMALATASAEGIPSVRIVLLKEHGPDGFVWYTDYRSQKGLELLANPIASAAFYWRDFDRQVRVTGPVSRIEAATSEAYFRSRPLDSRYSAAASEQSRPVANRRVLETRVAELMDRYPHGDVPRPEAWGGYRLAADVIEFWQGREGRLHDRFRYTLGKAGWRVERLQP
jgi:pyridoxamine 5'-phosphate oxidase